MPEDEFEIYLTLLAKTLRLKDDQRNAIASELRDHMEARRDELTRQGVSREQAIKTALAEFGDASALGHDLTHSNPYRIHSRRRLMQTTFGTLAACAAVTFGVMLFTPSNFRGDPNQPIASAQEGSANAEEVERLLKDAIAAQSKELAQLASLRNQQADDPNSDLRKKLEDTLISADFDEKPLSECLDALRLGVGINIVINWPALELVGIDKDQPVSMRLDNVPPQQVLHFVLAQASADCFDDDKAGSQLDNGVLSISTRKDLKSETQVRIYDVRQLLPDTDAAEPQQANQPSRGQTTDLIIEIIQRLVGTPDEWLDEKSTIIEFNGRIIIQTTSSNHEQINKLLLNLDDKAAVQTSRLW